MPRENGQFALRNAAPGPDGARPAADRGGTFGKPRKSLPSTPSSAFIRGIPVKSRPAKVMPHASWWMAFACRAHP